MNLQPSSEMGPRRLNRTQIAQRLPHAGRMCLLERVDMWDERHIRCIALSHRDSDNPLREPGGLPAWTGIEYAAQAAALHGSLSSGQQHLRTGVLASMRNVTKACEWLDRVEGALTVSAVMQHHDPAGGIYDFEIHGAMRLLLNGRFTLMFRDPPANRAISGRVISANDGII